MTKYTAEQLAIFATILTGVTRTASWATLGDLGSAAQEEVQMMQLDRKLYIACNHRGHSLVKDFLDKWGVADESSFLEALKWCYHIMQATTEAQKWYQNSSKRSTFSVQEKSTFNEFSFPGKLSSVPTKRDYDEVFSCVGDPQKDRTRSSPGNRGDWKTGRFQQLLGLDSGSRKYHSGFGPLPRTADFGQCGLTAGPSSKDIALVTFTGANVHAEIKLLSFLTKQVLDGKVNNRRVHLGGLKAACKKCAKWISIYQEWLFKTKEIRLVIPQKDSRPSATPTNWSEPNVDTAITGNSAAAAIRKLFL